MSEAEKLAKQFHKKYEEKAEDFGYHTRKESRGSWDTLPNNNKRLMVAVCVEILDDLQKDNTAEVEKKDNLLRISKTAFTQECDRSHSLVESLEKAEAERDRLKSIADEMLLELAMMLGSVVTGELIEDKDKGNTIIGKAKEGSTIYTFREALNRKAESPK